MPMTTAVRSSSLDWLQYFSGFVSRPFKVASLWPSSRDIHEHLAGLPGLSRAGFVVELGPGLGGTTRALLRSMPQNSRLLGIEIVEKFADHLRTIPDQRLRVAQACASNLTVLLQLHRLPAPDVVVSGIPFSAISRDEGADLMRQIHSALSPGGTFVAYQVRDRICELAAEVFGEPRHTVIAGFPRMHVYEWRKALTPRLKVFPQTDEYAGRGDRETSRAALV
jgi:phosphatidylethanolamine/phosphatidyl-N-methylethanolamine N-methyltransferase